MRQEAKYWATRTGGKSKENPNMQWYELYDISAQARQQYFINKILDFKPESILELGCCGGCNIQHLEEHKDTIDIIGVDINSAAIEYAKKTKPGYTFIQGDIMQPFDFLDFGKKVDVVCSMAVLIHIRPNAINDLLFRMLESSKKGLVLFEGHNKSEQDIASGAHYQTTYDLAKRIKDVSPTPVEITVKKGIGPYSDDNSVRNAQLHEIIVKKK